MPTPSSSSGSRRHADGGTVGDFELVQVGEEEEEQPQVVPGSRVSDARGRSWCLVVGPAGVYWWMVGTSTAQLTSSRRGSPPGQDVVEILAVVGALVVDVPVTMQRQIPASSSSSCLRSSSSTEWWKFQFATVTVAENCGGSAVAVPGSRMLCSTVDTYSASARETFGRISGFQREGEHSAPEVDSRPALLSSWPRTSSTTAVACF